MAVWSWLSMSRMARSVDTAAWGSASDFSSRPAMRKSSALRSSARSAHPACTRKIWTSAAMSPVSV